MVKKKKRLTYKGSGVNISAGNKAVNLIRGSAERTFKFIDGEVLSGIGGFCAAIELKDGKVVGASTDGVGTKLMVAILLGKHDTVGIDLVAMCVNDLLPYGIDPMFFLDYLATGKQVPGTTDLIVGGVAKGCEIAECGLIGGEMAELPGMYGEGEYDLAGFAVGFANSKQDLILGDLIRPGTYVYGLPSTGIHSNGYSLVRKLFGVHIKRPKSSIRNLNRYYGALGKTLGEELITPTKIYVNDVRMVCKKYQIDGMANITGGGLLENPIRVIPDNCAIVFRKGSWPVPPIFDLIQKLGNVADSEMRRTFNCGIGYVLFSLEDIKEAYLIGKVVERAKGQRRIRFV
jgi:phosphoribosylformylglycinamidine cyclo-ligase